MNNRVLSCLIAGALATTLALASPVLARGGGGGGGGHGGGMGGSMHGGMGGGMHGGMGGGMHFGGMGGGMHVGRRLLAQGVDVIWTAVGRCLRRLRLLMTPVECIAADVAPSLS